MRTSDERPCKIRIFLADDHAVLREGLKALLNAQADMEVIGEAGDGKSAWRQAKEMRPDVVLMDVSMPGMDGVQATEILKGACPEVKVLALTAHEDAHYLRQLLQAGAKGYLLKQAAADQVIHAIRDVAAGGVYLDPAIAGKVVSGFLGGPRVAGGVAGGEMSDEPGLSAREMQVLRLIAWGHGNKEIAAQLHISVHTVEVYRSRCMEKLGLQNRADIVRYAVQQGWLQKT